jgi:type VI secretion system protein ImpC
MFPSDSDFESQFTFETPANQIPEAPPFHILLLGDWSGNPNRSDLNARRPIVIDRDNFDEVIQRLKAGLSLDLHGDGKDILNLEFTELDDFHPDNLYRQVSLFSDLRDVRRRLKNSDTFDKAANEVRSWFDIPDANLRSNTEDSAQNDQLSPIDSNNLLDLILTQPNESATSAKPQKVDNSELGRFVSNIVSPYLINIDENEQSKLVAAVDEATSELMRAILHHPHFQELESAWRGLYFLVRRLETDVDLKIYILDISKDELIHNLQSINSLADSFLYRRLITDTIETPGGEPFAVVGGNYSFGANVDDVAALMRIAKLASAANAPFISHSQTEIFGVQNFAEAIDSTRFKFSEDSNEGKLWTALRLLPEASHIGLSPMKFLARLPYGELTDSTETFSFEEFTGKPEHLNYLWINPCFACLLLLAQSYRLYGWEMEQGLKRDIDNLPIHTFKENGETFTKPCAEILLTENLSELILEQGLMPLISFRDTNRIRLARFQSISAPPKNLSGKWNS